MQKLCLHVQMIHSIRLPVWKYTLIWKGDILGQWKGDKIEVDHSIGFGECFMYFRVVSNVPAVVQHAMQARVFTSYWEWLMYTDSLASIPRMDKRGSEEYRYTHVYLAGLERILL